MFFFFFFFFFLYQKKKKKKKNFSSSPVPKCIQLKIPGSSLFHNSVHITGIGLYYTVMLIKDWRIQVSWQGACLEPKQYDVQYKKRTPILYLLTAEAQTGLRLSINV